MIVSEAGTKHEVEPHLLRGNADLWKWYLAIAHRSEKARPWLRPLLFFVFVLLLGFVLLDCTISPSPFVAVALLVVAVVVILTIRYPQLALLFVFMGACLPSLQASLPGHVHLVEPALLLCLLAMIVRRPSISIRLPQILALLFVAIAIISFIHAPEISQGSVYGADKRLTMILVVFIGFFCGMALLRYIKNMSTFLVLVLLANIPLYLVGLGQAVGVRLPSFLEFTGAQDPKVSLDRLWGTTPWSSVFGMYLVNLFAIAVVCWLLGTRRRDRIIGMIMTVATVLEMVGSGTRSVIFAAAVIILCALIVTRRFKTLFASLLVVVLTTVVFANKILPKFTHDDTSTTNRLLLWNESIKLINSNPWMGVGLQHFRLYYAQLIISKDAGLNLNGAVPHQQFLEWAVESGILWAVIGILLLLSIVIYCARVYNIAKSEQKGILLAAILMVLANSMIGILDVPLDQVEGAVFLFLFAGLALSCADRIYQADVEQRTNRYRPSTPLLSFVGSTGIGGRLSPQPFRRTTSNVISLPNAPAPSPVVSSSDNSVSEASTEQDAAPDMQKTGRSVIIRLLSWGIAVPIIFPMTALLTRYLGPAKYGEYSFTFSYFAVIALFSGTGMDPLVVRLLSRKPREEWPAILSYAAGTRLFSTAISAILSVVVAFVMPIGAEQRNLLLLGSIALFFSFSFNCLRMVYTYGFGAEQQVAIPSIIEASDRVLTAVLVAVVVLFHLSLVSGYILIMYSDLPFFLILALLARRRYGVRIRFSAARAREHLLGSLSLTGYDALALLSGQAGVLLLLLLTGPSNVGIYALAMRITNPLLAIVYAYMTGLYPLLCRTFELGRQQFNKVYQEATRVLALGIIPLAIFISVEANVIVSLLGGQHFTEAAIALQLLMWAMAMTFFSQLAVRGCMAANMERQIPYVTAASVIINLVANFVLIPRLQFVGAGVAALLGEFLSLCLFSILLRRHISAFATMGMILRVLLGNVPMLAFMLWQQHTLLLLTAPVALLLTIVGCFATGTLSFKDIHSVQSMLMKRRSKKVSSDIYEQLTIKTPAIGADVIDEAPTLILESVQDISDGPTVRLPRMHI